MNTINIEFLEDENGQQQVVDLITSIAKSGKSYREYAELSSRVAQVLDYLYEVGVPPKDKRTIYAESLDSYQITLTEVVKELDNHPPLLELRANWKPIGAFRAIFFCIKDDDGNESIYFTKAVIKEATYSSDFEDAVVNSEKMMRDFFKPE